MEQNDFVKGALIGGVLGGVAALLLAPKSGKCLRDDICDEYECVQKSSSDLLNGLRDRGNKLVNKLNGVKEEEHSSTSLLSGGALGTVIGVLAALLLAPQSGSKLREQLGDKYDDIHSKAEKAVKSLDKTRHNIEDKIDDWKDIFSTVVEKLSAAPKKGAKAFANSDEIIEWATLGLRLYDKFHKRG